MGNARELSFLSDSKLIATLHGSVVHLRACESEVLRLIGEVDARKLYREHACSSMFTFCTQRLGMAEGAAYRRIKVARAGRQFPVLLRHLEEGHVHLAGLYMLSPHLTPDNAKNVLARAKGRSKREIEVLVSELAPKPDVTSSIRRVAANGVAATGVAANGVAANGVAAKKVAAKKVAAPVPLEVELPPGAVAAPRPATESSPGAGRAASRDSSSARVQPLSAERYHVRFTASGEFVNNLDRAKELAGFGTRVEELIEQAMELLVEKLEKKRLGVPGRKTPVSTNPRGRYLAKAVKRAVVERDGGQCTFTEASGRRCKERQGLHFDHVVPHARGGESTAENLRLRCGPHNQLHGERCFGPLFMAERRAG